MEFNNIQDNVHRKHLVFIVLIALLVFGNIFFGLGYFWQAKEARAMQQEVARQNTNVKVVNFLNLFIEKVLRSDTEVSFENRLRLENAVRDINDPEVLEKWEQFTNGSNEAELQKGVKDLLAVLVKKITY